MLASTQSTIGGIVLFAAIVIALTYAWINIRQSRKEIGSEIELAPNRKPYYSDEELEGKKLDRTLTFGLIGLFVVAASPRSLIATIWISLVRPDSYRARRMLRPIRP